VMYIVCIMNVWEVDIYEKEKGECNS
jgi:hypothetical protein